MTKVRPVILALLPHLFNGDSCCCMWQITDMTDIPYVFIDFFFFKWASHTLCLFSMNWAVGVKMLFTMSFHVHQGMSRTIVSTKK